MTLSAFLRVLPETVEFVINTAQPLIQPIPYHEFESSFQAPPFLASTFSFAHFFQCTCTVQILSLVLKISSLSEFLFVLPSTDSLGRLVYLDNQ